MGAIAVGATIFLAPPKPPSNSRDYQGFSTGHELGMATILWCYIRNLHLKSAIKIIILVLILPVRQPFGGNDRSRHYQAETSHLKWGLCSSKNKEKKRYGKYYDKMYDKLATDHPIDLCVIKYSIVSMAAPLN